MLRMVPLPCFAGEDRTPLRTSALFACFAIIHISSYFAAFKEINALRDWRAEFLISAFSRKSMPSPGPRQILISAFCGKSIDYAAKNLDSRFVDPFQAKLRRMRAVRSEPPFGDTCRSSLYRKIWNVQKLFIAEARRREQDFESAIILSPVGAILFFPDARSGPSTMLRMVRLPAVAGAEKAAMSCELGLQNRGAVSEPSAPTLIGRPQAHRWTSTGIL